MGRRKFRVIRGRRSDPMRFWPEARRKQNWSRYLPLWLGAVFIGLGYAYLTAEQLESGPDEPIEWGETQDVPRAVADQDDIQWAARSSGVQQKAPEPASQEVEGVRASFGFCHTGGGTNCVVDGDTIWLQGENIRIADIDAPETHEYGCASEKALGDRATQRLLQLVNGGTITLRSVDRDSDSYGRKLRIVEVNGTSVGDTLVSEGLARYFGSGKRPWC